MQTITQPVSVPVGTIKCFGAFGPKYEVGERTRQLDNGDWLVKIKMVETGETAEYSQIHLNDDPVAH
jgi:Family of unknown function (DUF5397)